MSKKGVYKFFWDCGRMGEVEGLFLSTEEAIAETIGKVIYLGEVLGKHSEIYGPLDEGDVTLITDDASVVSVFEEHNIRSGFNPLNYIQEEE